MVQEAAEGGPWQSGHPTVDLKAANDADDAEQRLRMAVLDTGATETVGSLDAIEYVMNQRRIKHGAEEVGVDVKRTKRFKFGNAEERASESYVLLPQLIAGKSTSLGVYTLDVPMVPILIGIKTMDRLGAVICVSQRSLIFTKVFPGVVVPLQRGRDGHLLLDLVEDWHKGHNLSSFNPGETQLLHDPSKIQPCEQQQKEQTPNVQRRGGFQEHEEPHFIQVVETKSESTKEADDACMNYASLLQDFQPQGSSKDSPSSPPEEVAVSHEALQVNDEGRHEPRRRGGSVQGDAGRGCQFQVEDLDQCGEVRLGQGSVGRPERQEVLREATFRQPSCGTIRQGLPNGEQGVCAMDVLPELQAASDVCANTWQHRHWQGSRTTGQGRQREAEESQRERLYGPGVEDEGAGVGGSRELSSQEVAADSGKAKFLLPVRRARASQRPWPQIRRSNRRWIIKMWPPKFAWRRASARVWRVRKNRRQRVGRRSARHERLSQNNNDHLAHEEPDGSTSWCVFSLGEGSRGTIMHELMVARDETEDIMTSLDSSKCDLIEVCGEKGSLTERVLADGGVAYRIGLSNKMDLSTTNGTERALEFARKVRPRWMWFSLPCNPNSPLQKLNQRNEEQIENWKWKRRKALKIIGSGRRLAFEQIERGGEIAWEWPVNNRGWLLKEVVDMFRQVGQKKEVLITRLDGCQVNLRAIDTQELMNKPWKIITTDRGMHVGLSMRCNGNHFHEKCIGHGRALHSAFYPEKMCRIISRVVLGYQNCARDSVMRVEDMSDPKMVLGMDSKVRTTF